MAEESSEPRGGPKNVSKLPNPESEPETHNDDSDTIASFLSVINSPVDDDPTLALSQYLAMLPLYDVLSDLPDTALAKLGPDPGDLRATFAAKKKYKPVRLKTRPIKTQLPSQFRIVRHPMPDALANMPTIDYANIPDFVPTGRYSAERMRDTDALHGGDFLLSEERRALHHFMTLHQDAFAWDDSERGRFKEEFFPPIEIPVVPHTPWVERNIPIPPSIYDDICEIIRKKIAAGVYEPSNATYRSKWFPVAKKFTKALRIVHSLEPLNAVTIQHSGVPPIPDHLTETFAGRACGGILDLYVGYDNRPLAEDSRDLTTFQSPFGLLRLTTLPMGWTNSVPIFHDDVTFILQKETPTFTIPYIDDVPVRGPATRYETADGDYERIPENPGIRRFVREHFDVLNRICQRMKYAGGTFSGKKSILIAAETTVLGYRCTYSGRLPETDRVQVIRDWGPCKTLSELRAFLGTVGVLRIWIRNFAKRAHHLVKLTRKGMPFEWGPEQQAAMEDLKEAACNCEALRPIDYKSPAAIVVGVDTSYLAVGYLLSQCDNDNPRLRYFARFGSITLNDRESRFSQPKLEIYGVYRTLKELKPWLIGVRGWILEVDAQHIKGMLRNPDIAPSAAINRWITYILNFHFTLVHVPGVKHGADGPSRRPPQPGDPERPEDDDDDFGDPNFSFVHVINPLRHIDAPETPSVSIFVHAESSAPRASASEALAPTPELPDDVATTLDPPNLTYADVPRSPTAQAEDAKLALVREYLETLTRPEGMERRESDALVRYALQFFVRDEKLWRRHPTGAHQLVVAPERRLRLLRDAHDGVCHRGVFATTALLKQRFWWPYLAFDVQWYVKTCHICQTRRHQHHLVPPTVAMPASLFSRVYADTMHLPPSASRRFIVQARCSLSTFPEWIGLRRETGKLIGDWIYESLLSRWGILTEIITDNGTPFIKALDYLAKTRKIHHIRVSGYNSRANGIVERAHYDVRQALYKAADGDPSRWYQVAHSVFWSERITSRKRLGCSPYFAVTGTHPVMPFDLAEATYLRPPPESVASTADLIAQRAIALQKRSDDLAKLRDRVFAARVSTLR